jgi:hypothetical protein
VTASGWQGEHEQEGQPEDAHLEPQRALDGGGESPGAGPDGEPVDEDDAHQRPRHRDAAELIDDELRLLLEFQGKLEEIMRSQLARLRGDDGTPPASG